MIPQKSNKKSSAVAEMDIALEYGHCTDVGWRTPPVASP